MPLLPPIILIAGGGIAGAATAAALAQSGRDVTIIERDTSPHHKICGEFLSVEAQHYLSRLGLDVDALGGHQITHVRLIKGAAQVTARLPFTGLSITRKALDPALRAHALKAGAHILPASIRTTNGLTLELDGQGPLTATTLFLATGKHELRGATRPAQADSALVGLKMYFTLTPEQTAALAAHVELYVFPGGYAGLQLVEGGQANLCLLINRDVFKRLGGTWDPVQDYVQSQTPLLKERLAAATPQLTAPLAIARVPYGYVYQATPPDHIYRLGDQAGVIHSFTGDGMAIALHSAALAAQTYLNGGTAAAYQCRLSGHIIGQTRRASALHEGLQNPFAGAVFFALARLFPTLLPFAARLTRVPARALLS